jgi:CheY-like chemotaxis protein
MEPLFNYDVKTSTRGTGGETGSGLGLPLCYDIMRVHGGILKVESEVGKGSVFQAILPYLRPAILLVDDDDLTLRIIKEMLKGHDCDIATALDGREALHLAGLRPPHLVITDLQMPEMDGYELIRAMRAHPLLKATPIIAITGKDVSEKEEILRQGADDFIVKSSLSSELLLRVGKFIP